MASPIPPDNNVAPTLRTATLRSSPFGVSVWKAPLESNGCKANETTLGAFIDMDFSSWIGHLGIVRHWAVQHRAFHVFSFYRPGFLFRYFFVFWDSLIGSSPAFL